MSDLSNYYNQIADIDLKIAVYRSAKTKLQREKGNFEEYKEELHRHYNNIRSFDIPSADVFEGEMAITLSKMLDEHEEDMSELVRNGEDVIHAIDGLIREIDSKIIELDNQKANTRKELMM